MFTTLLTGHTSFATGYLVNDYPYGFTLRCKIKYWLETTKHGTRFVSCTTNPKKAGEVWNKPKASTYSNIGVMGLNADGHVKWTSINSWATDAAIDGFIASYGSVLDAAALKTLGGMKVMNAILAKRFAAKEAAVSA